ncbi:MAG: aminoglycoside phosphotransferase family protein [Acidimicrobiaceae bacterium]|nr:aminoglycoside phosphotransferase family protein [Acidimicrobiaceae bacterium]
MTPRDVYTQPDAPDPVLESEHVLELVRRHVPSASRVTGVDESGGEARTYLCDDDVVLKVQRPHQLRPRTSLEKESFILRALERDSSISVPRSLGYGRDGSVEYLVLSRVPGVSLRDASLDAPSRERVLLALGAMLRRIHDVDQAALSNSPLIPGDRHPDDLATRLSETFEDLRVELGALSGVRGVIDLDLVKERCLAALASEGPIVTLHSNPGAEHCFVHPTTGELSGLIDFGDAYRSHPALDIRSRHSLADSRTMLAGYVSSGPLPEGFTAVWRTGAILSELRLLSRGARSPLDTLSTITDVFEEF